MTNQIEAKSDKRWTHRADNRDRLVAAGYQILAEKGYEATTVKEVTNLAGVSPGLFHYYFESKDELFIAVIHEVGTRYGQMMQGLKTTVPPEQFLEMAILAARDAVGQEPARYRLRYELFALGLRNPIFLPVLGELLNFIRQTTAESLQTFAGSDSAQAQGLAAIVVACFDGLALQQLAQPEADLRAAYDQLLAVIRAARA